MRPARIPASRNGSGRQPRNFRPHIQAHQPLYGTPAGAYLHVQWVADLRADGWLGSAEDG